MSGKRVLDRIMRMPRRWKQSVFVAVDALLAIVTLWIAFSLRLGTWFVIETQEQAVIFLLSPALAIPIFIRSGLYRAIFRYSGFGATAAIARAVSIYMFAFGAIVLALSLPNVTRSVAVIQPVLFAWCVLAVRSFIGIVLTDPSRSVEQDSQERLLIYGAGVTGIQTLAALRASGQYRVIGFIDNDETKVGREIMGLKVYGRIDAEGILANKEIDGVLLAIPNAARPARNAILEWLRPYQLHVRSVPSVLEITTGQVTLTDLRELDIEDLLGRDPVPENLELLEQEVLDGTVLVTGAGGSIGSELCRQLLHLKPAKILLLDSSELALYTIHDELEGLVERLGLAVKLVPLLGDVQDKARVEAIVSAWRPLVIYHAAAYKHVPLVQHNPTEGISNNIFATVNVAQAAIVHRVRRFVLVSTDKAVRPTNVMGATKRVAEIALQAMAAERMIDFGDGVMHRNETALTMVRFGNVLGSSGSVVPRFRAQLAAGGPITVTHLDVTRYFMTIPEAAQLVLQAGANAKGGEVFLLDMGEPVRIFDLARRVIELSGFTVREAENPKGDIEIAITGLRPGEKLYEELLIEADAMPTEHSRIMRARERMWPWREVQAALEELRAALHCHDIPALQAVLGRYVDGFPTETAVPDWVKLEHEARNAGFEPLCTTADGRG